MTTAATATQGKTPNNRGKLTPSQFAKAVSTGEIRWVRIATVDLQGRLRGKTYPAASVVKQLLNDTLHLEGCGYLLDTDLGMTPTDRLWRDGYGDVRLAPDIRSARMLPWVPYTALVLADPLDTAGQRLAVAPGTVLSEQLSALVGHGLEMRIGLETEFVIYHTPAPGQPQQVGVGPRTLRPTTGAGMDYAFDLPPKAARFIGRLMSSLADAGLPVEAVKAEGAPGQLEITFPYGQAPAACEQHVLLKDAARTIAERHGMAATFMAAPSDETGSGMHLHLSLWHGDEPVLAAPDHPEKLSRLGEQAAAGLLTALPALMPLLAPYINSYKRYRDHSFAPTRFTWGRDNRGCAVRVIGHGPGLHLEVRLPGADANPYLVAASAAAAVRRGIEQDLALPAPIRGDAYLDRAAPAVPPLHQALHVFETSDLAAALFGEQTVDHYALAVGAELDFHQRHVSDLEIQRGFDQA